MVDAELTKRQYLQDTTSGATVTTIATTAKAIS